MRLNFFSRDPAPEPQPPSTPPPTPPPARAPAPPSAPHTPNDQPTTGKTFPADEVVWGIAIRNGYDELDDPLYHRGTTQHAYLEGSDAVAICGFRPPQSGPRTRRRARLGLPTSGEHPMCGMCARMVVAPRPRVPVPVQSGRSPVAVPVQGGAGQAPVPVAVQRRGRAIPPPPSNGAVRNGAPAATAAAPAPAQPATSPWVQTRSAVEQSEAHTINIHGARDTGLMERGVHATVED